MATQTSTQTPRGRAALVVCAHARNTDDALLLLDALGLREALT